MSEQGWGNEVHGILGTVHGLTQLRKSSLEKISSGR